MKGQRGKTPRKKFAFTGTSVIEPVEVYCRIKPADDSNNVCLKSVGDNQVQLMIPADGYRNAQPREFLYTFQQVFDETSTQKDIFDVVSLPLVEDLIAGRNTLLFTYGVTGSGKTYTMTGTPVDQGILPRCLDVVFNTIEHHQAKKYVFEPNNQNGFRVQSEADAMAKLQADIMPCPSVVPKTPKKDKCEFLKNPRLRDKSKVEGVSNQFLYSVFVSYVEVYNNAVYDLLEELTSDPIIGYKAQQTKTIREDSSKMMYIHECKEVEVKNPDEAFHVIYQGQNRRRVARTALNESSSRSHSVFNIRIVQGPVDQSGEEVMHEANSICVGQLSLVDLAGSERTVRTKNMGEQLREASNINNTLMTLRNCIDILRENQKFGSSRIVPYRDSKLTHLFKSYLEGDGKIRMVVCVNPAANEVGETLHVMKFAEITQEVTIQRIEGRFQEVPETPNGRLYPNLEEEFRSDTGSDCTSSSRSTTVPVPLYDLGPQFPNMELVHPSDDSTLKELHRFLGIRLEKRQRCVEVARQKCDDFRSLLLKVEKENSYLPVLEKEVFNLRRENTNLKQDNLNINKELKELQQELRAINSKLRSSERQLQEKNSLIREARDEKCQLKSDYETRIQQNEQKFRQQEYDRQKLEYKCRTYLQEKDRKLNILKNLVNEHSSESSTSTTPSVTPKPARKLRTFTTPAPYTAPRPDPAPRKPVTRLAAARSLHNLDQVSSSSSKKDPAPPPPPPNPRHRRSKSSSAAETWLEHKSQDHEELGTLFQPKLKKKRSVTKLTEKDTKEVSKYCLNHQELGSDGEMRTKLYKGNVLPTATGGCTMVFNEVEMVRRGNPGNGKKRHSPPNQHTRPGSDWTDTDVRCGYAIDGHKRPKPSQI
ncbi:kinesin-like protein KIF23 isoform X2 [Octopus sinensis]|uniref:Kinesin-like protein n=1 Tax=Octopus sinensis TaxID=2607531 RepID=A0A6P7T5L2_9MOLL|nr:kinesin-like protein KIF23 isoform X2 [Octopus sinensis]